MINLLLVSPNIFFINCVVKEICFSNAKLRDFPNTIPKSSIFSASAGISTYMTSCPTTFLINVVFPVPYLHKLHDNMIDFYLVEKFF